MTIGNISSNPTKICLHSSQYSDILQKKMKLFPISLQEHSQRTL